MPYIPQIRRNRILSNGYPIKAGELNYLISKVCHDYVQHYAACGDSGYGPLNDVIGALEAAKLEFYHIIVRPYEEKKRVENGGVSELEGPIL